MQLFHVCTIACSEAIFMVGAGRHSFLRSRHNEDLTERPLWLPVSRIRQPVRMLRDRTLKVCCCVFRTRAPPQINMISRLRIVKSSQVQPCLFVAAQQLLEFIRFGYSHNRPGLGPFLATAFVAGVADPKAFRSGRTTAGLRPKQNSTGGKQKLGSICKQGDCCLRSRFTAGALAVIRYVRSQAPDIGHGSRLLARPWRR